MSTEVDYYDVYAIVDELRETIGTERVDRMDAVDGLVRMVNSRTEHLA